MFRAYIKPILKTHVYKSAVDTVSEYGVCLRARRELNCRFVQVPLEDGFNVGPKHVRLRHDNSIKLCFTLVAIHLRV
jgi:hypothetical protein